MSPSVSVCTYSPPRASRGERGEREKGSRKISGKGFECSQVPSSSAWHSSLTHLQPARRAARRAQLKRPSQGAALIGPAPFSLAFRPVSSGVCVMVEGRVEMILPSSTLTEVSQNSKSWAAFLEGTGRPCGKLGNTVGG